MSFLRISKSSALEILPSPFLSMAFTNWLTSSLFTYRFRPRLLKASLIRQKISFPYSVPLLSESYLLKIASIACRSWSSLGLEVIDYKNYVEYNLHHTFKTAARKAKAGNGKEGDGRERLWQGRDEAEHGITPPFSLFVQT